MPIASTNFKKVFEQKVLARKRDGRFWSRTVAYYKCEKCEHDVGGYSEEVLLYKYCPFCKRQIKEFV